MAKQVVATEVVKKNDCFIFRNGLASLSLYLLFTGSCASMLFHTMIMMFTIHTEEKAKQNSNNKGKNVLREIAPD